MTIPSNGERPVVFLDVGGVLFHNVIEDTSFLRDLAAEWSLPEQRVRESYAARQDALEVGQGTLGEIWRNLRGPNAHQRDSATAASLYLRNLAPIGEGWEFARDVATAHPVYLTNNEVREWDALREHCYPTSALVQGRMPSHALGIAKPMAEYFDRCLARLEMVPTDVVYFDDDEECVAAAEKIGIRSCLWTGARAAREYLLHTQHGSHQEAFDGADR